MKRVPFYIFLFGSLAAVCLFAVCNPAKADQEPVFMSCVSTEQCVLCSKLENINENNLFLFDINTFFISHIPILRYDPVGIKLEGPFSTVTSWSMHAEGLSGSGFIYSDRQFASGSIKFGRNCGINADSVSALYCQGCLDHMLDTVYDPFGLYGVGIINAGSKEVRLLESSVFGFSFGDYYVQCIPYQDNNIHLTLIYAPVSAQ